MNGEILTTREIYAKGLVAGMSITEMRHLEPGFVMDMFKRKAEYDAMVTAPAAAMKALGAVKGD